MWWIWLVSPFRDTSDLLWQICRMSVLPFIVATSALVEYGHSLISRPDLFYDKKYLVAPTFKTSMQQIFKSFPWFLKLPCNTFYIFSGWIKNWIHVCFSPFSLCLKINMDKTSQKTMKLQGLLIIQAMKIPTLLTMQAMKLPALATPPPQDQMILMSMALVYLLFLPLAFLYFLHITLLRLKLKNSSMKNRINNQNVVIYFRSYIINNKWVTVIIRKKIKKPIDDGSTVDTMAIKKPIGDGLLITTVTAMATGIFFRLRTVDVGQQGALLTSTSFVYFVSFF